MNKVTSFLRFVLLMIGSFFLAIGILIVNACRSLNDRPRTGIRTPKTQPTTRPVPTTLPALSARSVDELIAMLDSDKYTDREAAERALTAKGRDTVPKLTNALTSGNAEVVARVKNILSVLGWYVTRAGKVEKMSESKEFKAMMRKRLPEMPAE
jgi:hypothetical protein